MTTIIALNHRQITHSQQGSTMTYHSTRLTKVEVYAIEALLDLSPGTRKRLVLEVLRQRDALKQKEHALWIAQGRRKRRPAGIGYDEFHLRRKLEFLGAKHAWELSTDAIISTPETNN